MKTTFLAVSLLGILALTVWWIFEVSHTIGGFSMPVAGWVALAFGVVLSLIVGIGLMFLVFRSSRKGHDEPPQMLP